MAGWLTAMLVMAIAGRETTRELDVFQIMEMRSVIGLAMLYPLIHLAGGFGKLKTARPWQQVGRNIAHYGAQFAWFKALTLIPLAQVISIEFTMPIWVALFAWALSSAMRWSPSSSLTSCWPALISWFCVTAIVAMLAGSLAEIVAISAPT